MSGKRLFCQVKLVCHRGTHIVWYRVVNGRPEFTPSENSRPPGSVPCCNRCRTVINWRNDARQQVSDGETRSAIIEDGFGGRWPAYCQKCGAKNIIIRPGDCRCSDECYKRNGGDI